MVVHGPYPVGEPRVAREVGVALAEGFDVDVLAMRRPGEPAHEIVDGASVVRLPLSHRRGVGLAAVLLEYGTFATLASGWLARAAVRRRYEVVQIHNPPDLLIVAALLPKLCGARVLLDIHDLSSDMFAMRFAGRRGAPVAEAALRRIERWAARAADAVLTVHEPYRRELARRGVPADKVTVVMNSLDERLLPAPIPPAGNGVFRVFYHGSITPSYGVELLVEAAAAASRRIDDLRLEIHGDGDSVTAIRRRADELGITDRLVADGRYLPHAEVLVEAQRASVGVIPNLPTRLNQFALSSKLLEYVALGIPVVSASLPTIREHFSDEEILFFEAGDVASCAAALVEVAADPAAAARRVRAARKRYEAYRWGLNGARYAQILKGAGSRVAAALPAQV